MPSAPPAQSTAFLSLVSLPTGMPEPSFVSTLADASGIDSYTLQLRLRQALPTILGTVTADRARRSIEAILRMRGDGFAPTLADLLAFGATIQLRSIDVEPGRLVCHPRRGQVRRIPLDDIDVIVRANLRAKSSEHTPLELSSGEVSITGVGGITRSNMRGVYEPALSAATESFGGAKATRPQQINPVLDLHLRDGSVLQVLGRRFHFGVLGSRRAFHVGGNMDKLAELLAHLAPDAIIDPYYELWRAPTEVHRLRLPDQELNREDRAFAFYSRWVSIMYTTLQHDPL